MPQSTRKGRKIGPAEPEHVALDSYLAELRRLPQLAREEEHDLAVRCRAGDEDARAQLVRANLRFVVSIAKTYQDRGVPLEDLISEGNLGLLLAAKRFDPNQGVKFISYAVWWIRQRLQLAVNNRRLIRVPPKQHADLRLVMKTADVLLTRLEREPTVDEIAQVAELSVEKTMALMAASKSPESLDRKAFAEGGPETVGDLLCDDEMSSPEDEALNREQTEEIERHLAALPTRDATVLRLYFGLGEDGVEHTLEAIGERLDISRERVRQIRDRAIRGMRANPRLSA